MALYEQYPHLARMVIQGGIGADAEVEALIHAFRERSVESICQHLDEPDPSPLLVHGLRGWLGFFEVLCVSWIERHDVLLDRILHLFEQSFLSVLYVALPPDKWQGLGLASARA